MYGVVLPGLFVIAVCSHTQPCAIISDNFQPIFFHIECQDFEGLMFGNPSPRTEMLGLAR